MAPTTVVFFSDSGATVECGNKFLGRQCDMLTSKEGLISHVFGQILAYFGTFTHFLFIFVSWPWW